MEALLAAKVDVAKKEIALAGAEATWARARQAINAARPEATGPRPAEVARGAGSGCAGYWDTVESSPAPRGT